MRSQVERYLNVLSDLSRQHNELNVELDAAHNQIRNARAYAARPGANQSLARESLLRGIAKRRELVRKLEAIRLEAEQLTDIAERPTLALAAG
jgi:hypothetical protein